ncbi:hypothetical protein [Streptomyces mexicanus]|uniref:hypothetical protein n=1 Tax=Streptomyces mexicanus TaxID=178566 RepID=UPI0036847EF4
MVLVTGCELGAFAYGFLPGDTHREALSHGKPVAVTEYGTCAYRGAGELGGMAWQPPHPAIPDEDEQVRCLDELLDVVEEEGVDTALWFSFVT